MESHRQERELEIMLKPTKKDIVLTALMWLGIIIALTWAILKTFGYIHSPPWQEALPTYGFALTLGIGIYKFGLAMGDIRRSLLTVRKDIGTIKNRQDNMAPALIRLETRMDHVEAGMKELHGEFKAHVSKHHAQ